MDQDKVRVKKAPAYVMEMLGNQQITIPIATSFDAIEEVLLEAQRNILQAEGETSATIEAIAHLLNHYRLFRDQGARDIIARERPANK